MELAHISAGYQCGGKLNPLAMIIFETWKPLPSSPRRFPKTYCDSLKHVETQKLMLFCICTNILAYCQEFDEKIDIIVKPI